MDSDVEDLCKDFLTTIELADLDQKEFDELLITEKFSISHPLSRKINFTEIIRTTDSIIMFVIERDYPIIEANLKDPNHKITKEDFDMTKPYYCLNLLEISYDEYMYKLILPVINYAKYNYGTLRRLREFIYKWNSMMFDFPPEEHIKRRDEELDKLFHSYNFPVLI